MLALYKGITEASGLHSWPVIETGKTGVITPGFLSELEIAIVYSEPSLTGSPNQNGMIAKFNIDQRLIEDRTQEFIAWCDQNNNNDYDVSLGFPDEWRADKSIWTIRDSGSGHSGVSCYNGVSFVYCGVLLEYEVLALFRNQDEWVLNKQNIR